MLQTRALNDDGARTIHCLFQNFFHHSPGVIGIKERKSGKKNTSKLLVKGTFIF